MYRIVDHLEGLLLYRGHFNIDDEMQMYNVRKLRDAYHRIFSYNPIFDVPFKSTRNIDKYNQYLGRFESIDPELAENIRVQFALLSSYKKLWSDSLYEEAKGIRGMERKDFHRMLFYEYFANILSERGLEFDIHEELNICYLKRCQIYFPNTFLDILKIISGIGTNKDALFFRGHEDSSYRLIPSIYRGNAPFYERELLYDAINLLPAELQHTSSNFEILTKLQHFGTPTRLLDITTNPLVGLFFACVKRSTNGELLCFSIEPSRVKMFDSDTVSILSNLSKMPFGFSILRNYNDPIDQFNDSSQIKELVHKIRNEKSYFENIVKAKDLVKSLFVTSKLDNPRIIRQSGAFIICGMNLAKVVPSPEIFNIEQNTHTRIIIPKKLKQNIVRSLDIFNITGGSLFPDLSEVSRYIKNKYGII